MGPKCYINILTALVLQLMPLSAFSQQNPNTNVKNKQRAILIYNFAQQTKWDNYDEFNSFNIGVLGDDSVINDLKTIANSRKLQGKPITVKKITSITNIKNLSLLYVHERFNYEIDKILRKVSKKNTLIISENYKFNTSMINIINTGENFQYELNNYSIQQEGFVLNSNLTQNAITSEIKWQELYSESQKYLSSERHIVAEQKQEILKKEKVLEKQKEINKQQVEKIESQKEIIIEQFEYIDKKETRLQKLETVKNEQNQLFRQKIALLDSLENFIEKQEKHINLQEEAITSQEEYLSSQLQEINAQKEILKDQKKEIKSKSNQVYFAFTFAGLALLSGFFIFRSYRLKKHLNKELSLKNIAIEQRTKALENQNVEMEQFAYIASHDLQEPLNTITSFIQLIDEQYKDSLDEIGKQSITYIGEASKRMKVLITSLLEYSRLGKAHNLELVNCNLILNDLRKDLKELISKSKTTLNVGVLPSVLANKVEIRLLFQNLITNGIKFMPKDRIPEIKISCKEVVHKSSNNNSKLSYKFFVADNGIGIKEEHLQKIFAIFQRLHNSEEYKGTGIGLAHCKKIVESLGGEIGVISEENIGSTFWFTIPKQKLQEKTLS